jgi:hypothetical protein
MPARDAGQKAHRKLVAPSAIDATDEARAETQPLATAPLFEDLDNRERYGNNGAKFDGFIAVVDSHTFIGECIQRKGPSTPPSPRCGFSST